MYDKFTDRARKVMQLANLEAQRYGNPYIGTEHILLGLIKEGTGVAANVLRNLNVDPDRIRRQVENLMQTGPNVDIETPQTPRAKKVIEFAIEEARHLKHNHVGTEHMLLGLLREEEGAAAQVLTNLGLTLDAVRKQIVELLGQQPTMAAVKPQSPPESLRDLPTRIGSAVAALDELVYVLQEIKEHAVSRHDFEWAADVRDQADKLRKMRGWLLANKDRELHQPPGQDPA